MSSTSEPSQASTSSSPSVPQQHTDSHSKESEAGGPETIESRDTAGGPETANSLETATLGGGCFWCLEAVYQQVRGVREVMSGYAGGFVQDPTYRQVCDGTTGHAEVVQVRFDPAVVSYEQLLLIFFGIHDPTSLNRQGADVGTQYRSIVLTHSPQQDEAVQRMIEQITAEGIYDDPIVTEVEPADEFWMAEPYHHRYFERNPQQAYCSAVVAPKVAKFRASFAPLLEPSA